MGQLWLDDFESLPTDQNEEYTNNLKKVSFPKYLLNI